MMGLSYKCLIRHHTGNYSNMLGFGKNESLTEYLRLYIALHGDHEGGNASAHTSRLCTRPDGHELVLSSR